MTFLLFFRQSCRMDGCIVLERSRYVWDQWPCIASMSVERDWSRLKYTRKQGSVLFQYIVVVGPPKSQRIRGRLPIYTEVFEFVNGRLLGQIIAPVRIHFEIGSVPGL